MIDGAAAYCRRSVHRGRGGSGGALEERKGFMCRVIKKTLLTRGARLRNCIACEPIRVSSGSEERDVEIERENEMDATGNGKIASEKEREIERKSLNLCAPAGARDVAAVVCGSKFCV